MAEANLQIVATLKVKPDSKEWVLENVFKKLVEESRKESGCLSYVLNNDVKDSNVFVFVETWKSQADIDTHNNSAHFTEAVGKLKDHLTEAPEIRVIKHTL